jgi:hypothetical protein
MLFSSSSRYYKAITMMKGITLNRVVLLEATRPCITASMCVVQCIQVQQALPAACTCCDCCIGSGLRVNTVVGGARDRLCFTS